MGHESRSTVACGSYYQEDLTEAGLWDVRQEKRALADVGTSPGEVWWVAGSTAAHGCTGCALPKSGFVYVSYYVSFSVDGSKVSCASS